MAKKSLVAKNIQRQVMVAKYKDRRTLLRARSKDLKLTLEERMEARAALSMLPSNSAATKVRNRCQLTGRTRAYLRKFGVCRNALRLLAHQGDLPGVTKASW
jgi:small subunit ribosomal protein S14